MNSDTKFRINLKEGVFELEGNESFVDKHLEKFEDIFKLALKEAIMNNKEKLLSLPDKAENDSISLKDYSTDKGDEFVSNKKIPSPQTSGIELFPTDGPFTIKTAKHSSPKVSINIPPLPVDLKQNSEKIGLREFYKEKKPSNHYEKTTLFVYYITKFNKQNEVKYGEILSCYEEINEKKPSIIDIVKNSIRYKGWLEGGVEKFSTRLTISGENFVKFDLPKV